MGGRGFGYCCCMTNPTTDAPLGPDEAACSAAAGELLRRHERDEPEANITSAVRDFLIAARLCRPDEIVEENPPSPDSSRRAVDLTALDTFIESKRRIGMGNGACPTLPTSRSWTATWRVRNATVAYGWAS